MTDTLVGANPDDLDRVAGQVERSARKLAEMHSYVTSQLRSSAWAGADAEGFERQWSRQGVAKLTNAATLLEAAASALRRNAEQQRRTSEAVTGDFTAGAGGDPGKGGDPTGDESLDDWATSDGRDDALRLQDASDAEQLAWWNSLTKAEQRAMLDNHPELLLGMALPKDVLAKANAAVIANLAETIAVGEEAERGELWLGGSIGGWDTKITAGVEAKATTFADGSTEVKVLVDAEAEIGTALKAGGKEVSADIGLKGEIARTYRFDSPEEAQKFIDAMKGAVKPDGKAEGFEAVLGAVIPPVGANYVAGEFKEVLDRYDGNYKDSTVAGELNGDVNLKVAGVGDITVEGGIGVEHNLTDGSTKGYIAVRGSGGLDLPELKGAANGDLELAVKWDKDGNLEEVKVSGSYDEKVGQGAGGNGGPLSGKVLAGGGGSFEASLDLSDKGNRELALDLIKQAGRGNTAGAVKNFGEVFDASTVVVQGHASTSVEGEVDLQVAGGKYEHSTKNAVVTTVKPPHGSFGILKVKK